MCIEAVIWIQIALTSGRTEKAFNSRTCQVVLGAGAMRSAGLKNITAKHLGTVGLVPLDHRFLAR